MSTIASVAVLAASLVSAAGPQEAAETIPAVGPTGPMRQVATGLVFTEGPASDADGNLYFTDVRGNTVYKVDAEGNLSAFLEGSEGCNGLMVDPSGTIIACQGGAKRVIAIDPETKEITVLADAFEGQPFDRPNDLVLDRQGGVYFTDPGQGAVYYIDAERNVSRILVGLPRPNGVLLGPRGTNLYVLPSGSPEVLSYPLEGPGKPGEKVVLCELRQQEGTEPRGGDGLTVDERGVLYLTQPALSSIQVVAPNGNTLGFIKVPEAPSNCAFGGPDGKTLFITARTSVYAVPMEAKGLILATAEDEE
ncbi:SMP-30/gluconolactonase/LRE family protein [Tautonia plasticadhaerens]|uniref:Gluconolactonase n=1 Tax=Tautonia plasticadhaerens TaxID=2527974 RepID=A0A518H371_9BACT|nr:SMP-30/gluconolactonase/LRE family protein [Tautonia plasticadhaerens]QDV35283.1 Gluconolactonase precursor [Tautonia plasticadhaerens]